jgi:hypothetical protein
VEKLEWTIENIAKDSKHRLKREIKD